MANAERVPYPPSALRFAHSFARNGADALYRATGSITGTLRGTASIASGVLTCDADGEYLDWPVGAGSQVPGVAGAVVFAFTPNYSGDPVTDAGLFGLKPDASTNNNRTYMYHNSGPKQLYGFVADNSASQSTATIGTWTPVADREYVIALAWKGWDGSAGTAEITNVVYDTVAGTWAKASTTGLTRTRDEAHSDGFIECGNYPGVDYLEMQGDNRFLLIFSGDPTSVMGQDLTGTSWDWKVLYREIFERGMYPVTIGRHRPTASALRHP